MTIPRIGLCGTDWAREPPRDGCSDCGVEHDWRETERECDAREDAGDPSSDVGRCRWGAPGPAPQLPTLPTLPPP